MIKSFYMPLPKIPLSSVLSPQGRKEEENTAVILFTS